MDMNRNRFSVLLEDKNKLCQQPVKDSTKKTPNNKSVIKSKTRGIQDRVQIQKHNQEHNQDCNKEQIQEHDQEHGKEQIQNDTQNDVFLDLEPVEVKKNTINNTVNNNRGLSSNIDDKLGNNLFLNSSWTVYVHRNDCKDYSDTSYNDLYQINTIGSFWRFFNNFHNLNKIDNQYFIMRNKIIPKWENNENRNGAICSTKIDCYEKDGKGDILGCEAMILFSFLVMNEQLIPENDEINGIAYKIHGGCVMIKLWCKDKNNDISNKLPGKLLMKINNNVKAINPFKKKDKYINIKFDPMKPEY